MLKAEKYFPLESPDFGYVCDREIRGNHCKPEKSIEIFRIASFLLKKSPKWHINIFKNSKPISSTASTN